VKWERGEVGLGEKSRERTGDMEVREMGMNEKIVPKTQQIWHLGTPLVLPPRVIHF